MSNVNEARLPIACITMDPDLQPRHMIRESVVTEYLEDMRLGAQFPPVLVFRSGNRYWRADGWRGEDPRYWPADLRIREFPKED